MKSPQSLVVSFAVSLVALTCFAPAAKANGGGNSQFHYGRVRVSISPSSTTLQVGQSLQFNATVSGTNKTGVNWLVSGIVGGNALVGTITPAGLYTAPAKVPSSSVVVSVQSSTSPASSASASVTLMAPQEHTVSLSWKSSASSIAGYNVYRGTKVAGPFTKMNSYLETATVFNDDSAISGQTYYYATTAVGSNGAESKYSNIVQAIIP